MARYRLAHIACLAAAIVLSAATAADAADKVDDYAKLIAQAEGLTGWWRFEGDLKDARGKAEGKAVGGEAGFVAGPGGGKAVALDGKGLVTFGPAPHLDTPETSVELWFKPTFASAKYNPCIVAKRARGNHTRTRFSIHVWGDYSCLAAWNGKAVERFTPALGKIRRGQWYYLVVTSKAGEMRMYLDGVACEPQVSTASFAVGNKLLPMQIGSSTPAGQEQLACEIDELAVYARVLAPEEIAAHADAMGWRDRREKVAKELARRRLAAEAARKKRIAELSDPDRLLARGERRTYEGEHLTAVSLPLGGIGTGLIQMDGQGRLAVWQIFNNYPYVRVPNSFLAVRAKAAGGEPVVRALQTEAQGAFAAMEKVTFQGEYPFGWYTLTDKALPVDVRLEVFNPMIPLDVKNSGIPCVIFRATATNTGKRPADVSFLFSQQNAVGYTGKLKIDGRSCKEYGKNVTAVLADGEDTVLHMTSESRATAAGFGDMALATVGKASATTAWESADTLAIDLGDDGTLSDGDKAPPSEAARTIDGALAQAVKLKPGESKTVTFVLTWYFPNGRGGRGGWGGVGNYYQTWWKDALDVSRYVRKNLSDLDRTTRLYHDTLYRSNLPHWLIDRIANQAAILRTQTCFWTRDDYFGGWEGCCPSSGCCFGNCSHVWHYAQTHARLFPPIARRMREQEFKYMSPNGSIPFRQPKHGPATDGQCGSVLNSYREHLMSPDGAWLKKNWPNVKRAMEFIIATWDADEDGVMDGKQWNTLDCAIDGSSSWLGSLYLAALGAAERMADLQGTPEVAKRYRTIRTSGMAKQNETLFNGEYYIQLPGKTRLRDYFTGCHIDQMLGQWWANQLDLGWLFPRERVRSGMASLMKYNFRYSFHGIPQRPRKFVADEDAGMQMITWPKGGRPPGGHCMLYGDEVMTGFEYAAAGLMVQAGMVKEGFLIARAISDRYDGRRRTGLTASRTASWGWSGNPFGDDECGKFYARAMSNWSLLLACQGALYDGPAGVIGFAPVWQPRDHASFFTAAEGWGLFTQKRDLAQKHLTARLELTYGTLTVRELILQIPAGANAAKATVTLGGKELQSATESKAGRIHIRPAEPITLKAADKPVILEVDLSW